MKEQLITPATDNVLKGIVAAILTPLTKEGRIDTARLIAHAKRMFECGCSGVSTFGTTGEGVAFSRLEKKAAHAALLEADVKPHQILPAVMSTAVEDAADLLRDINEMGCGQVLFLPPFYYPNLTAAGFSRFIDLMYQRAGNPDIGLLLYNIPAMSGITITHDVLDQLLKDHGSRIIGVKDSTGDLQSGLAFRQHYPQLDIFTGDDRVLTKLVSAGGTGLIGGMPNLYAKDIVALYHAGESTKGDALAKMAAERISTIDANGGLLALKQTLAEQTSDPAWQHAAPPVGNPV